MKEKTLQYIPANNLPKGFSFLIDIICLTVLSTFIIGILNLRNEYWILSILILVYLGYSFVEYKLTTLGKLLFAHQVLNKDLSKPSFIKLLSRNILKLPFFVAWSILFLIPIVWVVIIAMSMLGVDFKSLEINRFNFVFDQILGLNVYKRNYNKVFTKTEEYEKKPEPKIIAEPKIKSEKLFNKRKHIKAFAFIKSNKIKLPIDLNSLQTNEVIILSVVIGVLFATLLGYIFCEEQFYDGRFRVYIENCRGCYRTCKFNYIVAILGFVSSSGIAYLFLNGKRNKQ